MNEKEDDYYYYYYDDYLANLANQNHSFSNYVHNITQNNDSNTIDVFISPSYNGTWKSLVDGMNLLTKAALSSTDKRQHQDQNEHFESSNVKKIDEENLKVIYKFLLDVNFTSTDDKIDLAAPHLKAVFRPIYPLAITLILYGLLILFGLLGNLLIVLVIRGKNLFKDNTQVCMMNMAVAFLIQLVFVIPCSLVVLVVQNWLLGYVMCYVLPMFQVSNSTEGDLGFF